MPLTKHRNSLIHASFFFVDIVGLSDIKMSTKTQIKKIQTLNNTIKKCDAFKNTPSESLIILPTGDGMCIGFKQHPEQPLLLASQLHEKLAHYNTGKIPSEIVRVRIGLHNGNCFVLNDLQGNENIWGPGIILCRRIMDIGDDGHILLTSRFAEDLIEMSDEYKKYLHPVHDFTIKHGQTILIYSAYGDDFGNPVPPTNGQIQKSRVAEEYTKIQKNTLYSKITVELTIKDVETMLVHHKRYYKITNIAKEVIHSVLHGIVMDVAKPSMDDLNIRVYDESGQDMQISSISINKPDCKEFTTKFNRPIIKGEKDRSYTLEYEIEEPERYFENAFLVDCDNLTLSIEFPDELKRDDVILYGINQETEEKIKSKISPNVEKNHEKTKLTWEIKNNVKGETFRIDW